MATWEGFSDRELQRLKQENKPRQTQQRTRLSNDRQAKRVPRSGSSRPSQPRAYSRTNSTPSETPSATGDDETTEVHATITNEEPTTDAHVRDVSKTTESHDQPVNTQQVVKDSEEDGSLVLKELEISADISQSNLALMQERQKQIEEENRRKKELLEKVLHERYKQTSEEAEVLSTVEKTLARLDSLVSRDVTILRNKIEEANKAYSIASKRFALAEKEYIESKLCLYRATEKKELLSEHLCSVIQHNEIRKSEKLAELMAALKLDSGEENPARQVVSYVKTPTPGIGIWPSQSPKSGLPSTKEDGESKPSTDTENDNLKVPTNGAVETTDVPVEVNRGSSADDVCLGASMILIQRMD